MENLNIDQTNKKIEMYQIINIYIYIKLLYYFYITSGV